MNNEQNNLNNGAGLDPTSLGGINIDNVNPNPVDNISDSSIGAQSLEQQANLMQSAINNINESINNEPIESLSLEATQSQPIASNIETTTNIYSASSNNQLSESTPVDNGANLFNNNQNWANSTSEQSPQLEPIAQPIPGTTDVINNDAPQNNSNSFVENKKTENIGTIPPEKKPKKKSGIKKVLFIFLILILMAAVAYLVYYYLSMGQQNNTITVDLKDVSLELNSEVPDDITSYATITGTNAKNCSLITTGIDTSIAGNYKYAIKCGDKKYEGNVIVLDTSELTLELKDVIVSVGETNLLAEDFIVADSCNKDNCKYEFVSKDKVNEYLQAAGTYEVEIKITSGSLEGTVKGNLIVINEKVKFYLNCSLEKENKTKTYKLAFGDENTYIGIGYLIYQAKFTNNDEYKKAVGEKETTLTYDEVTGTANYDDSKKILTINTKLTNELLDKEYGSTFPEKYIDIRNFYTEKGYTCDIER